MVLEFAGRAIADLAHGHAVDVDPVSGALRASFPISATAGRGDVGPALTLSYASSGGSSPFGLGWSLGGVPSITLDPSQGSPRYDGTDGYAVDGGEPLVPVLVNGGHWTWQDGSFQVTVYRPATGPAQVRWERWQDLASGRIHFVSRDARNVVSVFGRAPLAASRIADPADESRTYAWLVELQYDGDGNVLSLEWRPETWDGVDRTRPCEAARAGQPALAQRYLHHVRYGNTVAADARGVLPAASRFLFDLALEYGDTARPDPFSSHRPGFDLRTYRLCRTIEMWHDFPELGGRTRVGTTRLVHDESPRGTTLAQVVFTGHRGAESRSLPPLVFTYGRPALAEGFAPLTVDAPGGLTRGRTELIDLYGEGLPGLLTEGDRAWFYRANRGGGAFAEQVQVEERPSARPGAFAVGDADGDGAVDVALLASRFAGTYTRDRESARWGGFVPVSALPHLEAFGGAVQRLDLDGDGWPDLLVDRHDRFVWFPSDGEDAFLPPVEIAKPAGSASAPLLGTPARLGLYFADMTGDGRPDLVRIGDGHVEYWPNLGRGRFGDAVVMDGAPQFSRARVFDPTRLRFVDLDGSGTTDLLYVDGGTVRTFWNAQGNGWIAGPELTGLPVVDEGAGLDVAEILGDGRPCLVWSPASATASAPMFALPLLVELTQRRLIAVRDGLGQVQRIRYGHSSRHYLDAIEEGQPWRSTTAQHAVVVESVERVDEVAGAATLTRYRYRDGMFDRSGRRFVGFGRVDLEEAQRGESFGPALGTRLWFHPGREVVPSLRDAYRDAALPTPLVGAAVEGATRSSEDLAEALRAMAGREIRRETYTVGADGAWAAIPLEITERRASARVRQPGSGQGPRRVPALVVVLDREERYHILEGAPDDPRSSQELVLAVDAFDRVRRTAAVALPRRAGVPLEHAAQAGLHIRIELLELAHVDTEQRFELSVPLESREVALSGVAPGPEGWLTEAALTTPAVEAALAAPRPHHVDPPAAAVSARLLSWDRSYYWSDDRAAVLPWGQTGIDPHLHHEATACGTPAFATAQMGRDATGLAALGYVEEAGHLWSPGATQHYAGRSAFGALERVVRADGSTTRFELDAHALTPAAITDAVGNRSHALIDYYLVAPRRITDANAAVREVAYDPLGVVVAEGERGTVRDAAGVSRAWGQSELQAAPDQALTLAAVLADPEGALGLRSRATFYALEGGATVVSLVRVEHAHDGHGTVPAASPVEVAVQYHDGFGRVLQEKRRVEAGPAITRDAADQVVVDASGGPVLAAAAERWLSSGHAVYDGRQQAGRAYDPFYTPTSDYEADVRLGLSSLTLFDALGRTVEVLAADGSVSRQAFGAWRSVSWDPNDAVMGSAWQLAREGLPPSSPEKQALEQAKAHAGTPTTTVVDGLGRTVLVIEPGGATAGDRRTETVYGETDEPLHVIDPRGLVDHESVVDLAGRALATRSNDAGAASLVLDAWGRAVEVRDARGFVQTTTYDAADRVLHVHVTGPGLDHRVEERVYGEGLPDDARRGLRGRLAILRDATGQWSLIDCAPTGAVVRAERRLRAVLDDEPDWRQPIALTPEVFRSEDQHDALGRVVESRPPDGTVRRWRYGRGGALIEATVGSATGAFATRTIAHQIETDAQGRRTRARWGDRIEVRSGFDRWTGRQTSHDVARRPATVGGASRSLMGLRYTYDPVGNLVRTVDTAQEPSAPLPVITGAAATTRQDFAYDAHYRLVRATGRVHQALQRAQTWSGTAHLSLANGAAIERYTRTYAYDASGNLTALGHTADSRSWSQGFWIAPDSNRSLPAQGLDGLPIADPALRFDAAGNLTRLDHLRRMDWSWRGTLARAVVIERAGGNDEERYVYDASGRRLYKRSQRLVDGQLEVTEKIDLGTAELKRVRRGAVLRLERWTSRLDDGSGAVGVFQRWTVDVAQREAEAAGDVRLTFAVRNQVGSVTLELGESGEVSSYEEYFPYGGTAFVASDRVRELNAKDRRFGGKERDELTGLYDFGHRYYATWLCRWLSPDPSGPADAPNLYQFVLGDPVGNVDPDGLDTTTQKKAGPRVYQGGLVERPADYPAQPDPNLFYRKVDGAWVGKSLAEWKKVLGTDIVVSTPVDPRVLAQQEAEEFLAGIGQALKDAGLDKPLPEFTGLAGDGGQAAGSGGQGVGAKTGDGVSDGSNGSGTGAKGGGEGVVGATNGTAPGSGTATGTGAGAGATGAGSGTGPGSGAGLGARGTGRGGGGEGLGTGSGTGPGTGTGAGGGAGAGKGAGDRTDGKSGGAKDGSGDKSGSSKNGAGESDRPGSKEGKEGGSRDGVPGGTGREGVGDPGGRDGGTGTSTGGDAPPGLTPGGEGTPTNTGNGTPSGSGNAPGVHGKPGAPSGDGTHPDGGAPGGKKGGAKDGVPDGIPGYQPDALDQLTKVAGYANLEFSQGGAGGQRRGIPGGRGKYNLGWFGQVAYIGLTVVSAVGPGTVLKGARLGLKAAARGVSWGARGGLALGKQAVAKGALALRKAAMAAVALVRKASSPKGSVVVDNNALIGAIEAGETAAFDAVRAGRIPLVPITAAKEFLKKGDVDALRKFLLERGGRLARAGSEEAAAALRATAVGLKRSLRLNDSRIAASAVREGTIVITRDKKFFNFLNDLLVRIGGEKF